MEPQEELGGVSSESHDGARPRVVDTPRAQVQPRALPRYALAARVRGAAGSEPLLVAASRLRLDPLRAQGSAGVRRTREAAVAYVDEVALGTARSRDTSPLRPVPRVQRSGVRQARVSLLKAGPERIQVRAAPMSKKIAGVYLIKWAQSDSFYIGSSINVVRRISEHFHALRRGKHYNIALTAAYRKYGDTMTYYVLQTITSRRAYHKPYVLHDLEQDWIDDLDPKYNRTNEVRAPSRDPRVALRISRSLKGRPLSTEARENLSRALVGRKLSADHKRAISRGLIGREMSADTRRSIGNANRGRTVSPEHRDKIRAALTGYKHTPEARANMSSGQRGKVLSPEHVEKIRKRNTGSYKLSSDQLVKARSLFARLRGSERSRLLRIADDFGVSFSTARNVVRMVGPYRRIK